VKGQGRGTRQETRQETGQGAGQGTGQARKATGKMPKRKEEGAARARGEGLWSIEPERSRGASGLLYGGGGGRLSGLGLMMAAFRGGVTPLGKAARAGRR